MVGLQEKILGVHFLVGEILFLQVKCEEREFESQARDGKRYKFSLNDPKIIRPDDPHGNVSELRNIFNNILKRIFLEKSPAKPTGNSPQKNWTN